MTTILANIPTEPITVSTFVWWLIGAIVTMAGAMGWLHRDTIGRMERDKAELKKDFVDHKAETKQTVEKLNTDLLTALKGEQDARLKAATYEIIAKSPCPLDNCPRRNITYKLDDAPTTH